jgi:hypothetical protein
VKIRDSPDKGYPGPASASTPVTRSFLVSMFVYFYSGQQRPLPAGFSFFSKNKNDYKSEYSYSLTFSIQGPERLLNPPGPPF